MLFIIYSFVLQILRVVDAIRRDVNRSFSNIHTSKLGEIPGEEAIARSMVNGVNIIKHDHRSMLYCTTTRFKRDPVCSMASEFYEDA